MMRSPTKLIVLAVVAVVALAILRVEAEVRFGVDLFYVWLGANSAVIGLLFAHIWRRSSE